MVFFNKIILLLLTCSVVFSFSKKPKSISKEDFAILSNDNSSCRYEIQTDISEVLNINNLKLSKSILLKTPFIDLRNRAGIYKKFILHTQNSNCYISYIDKNNFIISSKKLKNCLCKRVIL